MMLAASISSLNVAVNLVLNGTFSAPAAGTFKLMVGGVVSGAEPVVNVQIKGFTKLRPVVSFTVVAMVAVQVLLAGKGEVGEKLATRLLET